MTCFYFPFSFNVVTGTAVLQAQCNSCDPQLPVSGRIGLPAHISFFCLTQLIQLNICPICLIFALCYAHKHPGVIVETEGSIRKMQKRALFHYQKVKKGTTNLTSPYVHSLFTIRSQTPNWTQFQPKTTPGIPRFPCNIVHINNVFFPVSNIVSNSIQYSCIQFLYHVSIS